MSIQLLLKLQEVDSRLFKAKQQLEHLPQDVQMLENHAKEARQWVTDEQQKIQACELKKRQLEKQVVDEEAHRVKLKTQQMSIRKQDEYDAMEKSLQHIKETTDSNESAILELLFQLDTHKNNLQKVQADCNVVLQRLEGERKVLEQKKSILEQELTELELEVKAARGGVAKRFLDAYDQARIRVKKPPFVVNLEQDRCKGCFMRVPIGVAKELTDESVPHFCDHCGRIIYIS